MSAVLWQENWRNPVLWVLPVTAGVGVTLADGEGNQWSPAGLCSDGDVLLAVTVVADPDDDGQGPSYPWTVGTVAAAFGPLRVTRALDVTPWACRWCERPQGQHPVTGPIAPDACWRWQQPRPTQVLARMLARRAVQLVEQAEAARARGLWLEQKHQARDAAEPPLAMALRPAPAVVVAS